MHTWEPQMLRDLSLTSQEGRWKNSMKNLNIGESNGHYVKSQESNGPQTIYDIDPDPCTGQMSKTHVLTAHVGDDSGCPQKGSCKMRNTHGNTQRTDLPITLNQ